MTRPDDRDDALVDTYRALRTLNGLPPLVPAVAAGAGPRVSTVRPGKRLRNWHRAVGHGESLRAFVRDLARRDSTPADRERSRLAKRWMDGKGIKQPSPPQASLPTCCNCGAAHPGTQPCAGETMDQMIHRMCGGWGSD